MLRERKRNLEKYKPVFWLAVFLLAPSAMYKADSVAEYIAVATVTIALSAILIFYNDNRMKRVKAREAKDLARFRRLFRLSRARQSTPGTVPVDDRHEPTAPPNRQ
ncbi:MAG: hypothetical protein AAGL24_29665 [Pseudomonadota bacterium]